MDYVDWGKFEGRKSFPEISFGMECRPDKEKPFFLLEKRRFFSFSGILKSDPEGRVLPYSPAYLVEVLIGGDTLRYVGVGFLGLTLPPLYVPLCIKEVESPFVFCIP